MPVFTVGHEASYDRGIRELGRAFRKLGRRESYSYPDGTVGPYSGGFACQSVDEAMRLIEEVGEHRNWAVYELDADWDRDTMPSESDWWRVLVNDAVVLRKVEL